MLSQSNNSDTISFDDITEMFEANITARGLVSYEITAIFLMANHFIISGIIIIFGSIANIINITVFLKIGFKDPVNITLFALAISDFGCCFSLIFLAVCYNPQFQQLDLPFDPLDFHYLTSGWIHVVFTRITSCITAFVTFERCLCVAAPLKVKSIITPRRVTIYIISIFTFVIASVSPIYYIARYRMNFHPERNKTILRLIFIENSENIRQIVLGIVNTFIPIVTFVAVVVFTIVLVLNLREKSKWRQKAASSSNSVSTRDTKVSKMVVNVATVFIICFFPAFVSFTVSQIVPDFHLKGRFENIFLIMFSFFFSMEALNSSLNIFIYYNMSSNYRNVFQQLFKRNKKE